MKRLLFIILFALTAIAIVFANESVIRSFTAESGGDYVTVKWTTENEANVKQFEVERSAADNNFKKIHQKLSDGKASNYSYIDEEAFMKQGSSDELQAQKVYSYRIKVVYKDNSNSYTDEAYVAHKPSSIRRTWGMIKEMFR
ncbi:MAG TPA: hypothetical protein PLE30_02010 [Candidatus Kapabacteria bacterium]|nr:hypothetical protein [Candidatus Kapabacteria bacterium]